MNDTALISPRPATAAAARPPVPPGPRPLLPCLPRLAGAGVNLVNAAYAAAPHDSSLGRFRWGRSPRPWSPRVRLHLEAPVGRHEVWLESLQQLSPFFSGPFPTWPHEQWNLLVEMATAPILDALAQLAGAPMRVMAAECLGAAPAANFEANEERGGLLFFRFQPAGTTQSLAGALRLLPQASYRPPPQAAPELDALTALPLPLRLELGVTRMACGTLLTLSHGDVLRLDAPPTRSAPRLQLHVAGSDRRYGAHAAGRELRLCPPEEELLMPVPPLATIAGSPEEDVSELRPADIDVALSFDLGEVCISLADLARFTPGHVLQLGHNVLDQVVTLRVNGQPVGRGELVALGDELAVRITRWAPPAPAGAVRTPLS